MTIIETSLPFNTYEFLYWNQFYSFCQPCQQFTFTICLFVIGQFHACVRICNLRQLSGDLIHSASCPPPPYTHPGPNVTRWCLNICASLSLRCLLFTRQMEPLTGGFQETAFIGRISHALSLETLPHHACLQLHQRTSFDPYVMHLWSYFCEVTHFFSNLRSCLRVQ